VAALAKAAPGKTGKTVVHGRQRLVAMTFIGHLETKKMGDCTPGCGVHGVRSHAFPRNLDRPQLRKNPQTLHFTLAVALRCHKPENPQLQTLNRWVRDIELGYRYPLRCKPENPQL
jgi:hypothetical protein